MGHHSRPRDADYNCLRKRTLCSRCFVLCNRLPCRAWCVECRGAYRYCGGDAVPVRVSAAGTGGACSQPLPFSSLRQSLVFTAVTVRSNIIGLTFKTSLFGLL